MPSTLEHLVVDRVDQIRRRIAQNVERRLPDFFAGAGLYAAARQTAHLVHTWLLIFLIFVFAVR